jgi:hypothetical protein
MTPRFRASADIVPATREVSLIGPGLSLRLVK